jgi:putative membrane protein
MFVPDIVDYFSQHASMTAMPAVLSYVLYLATAIAVIMAFFVVYTRVTPYDEVHLIREGNSAAALSLSGTLLGFSITVASAMTHTSDYYQFLGWGLVGMLVQLLVFVVATRLLRMSKDQIEAGNSAFGGLLGAISLSIGLVNAASIS